MTSRSAPPRHAKRVKNNLNLLEPKDLPEHLEA